MSMEIGGGCLTRLWTVLIGYEEYNTSWSIVRVCMSLQSTWWLE
jgi:hypothetical protein